MSKEKKVGKITHFFGKINVGVLSLEKDLKVGDKIHIVGGDGNRDFTQEVISLQVEHENIKKASAGDAVGIKLEGQAKEGDEVYLAKEE
ncbi:MAG TPA: hypothetical protein VJ900_02170 [Patescibacteria group bacterium]|nr:hypothetical protein [Patescibacteria group bacterium]